MKCRSDRSWGERQWQADRDSQTTHIHTGYTIHTGSNIMEWRKSRISHTRNRKKTVISRTNQHKQEIILLPHKTWNSLLSMLADRKPMETGPAIGYCYHTHHGIRCVRCVRRVRCCVRCVLWLIAKRFLAVIQTLRPQRLRGKVKNWRLQPGPIHFEHICPPSS